VSVHDTKQCCKTPLKYCTPQSMTHYDVWRTKTYDAPMTHRDVWSTVAYDALCDYDVWPTMTYDQMWNMMQCDMWHTVTYDALCRMTHACIGDLQYIKKYYAAYDFLQSYMTHRGSNHVSLYCVQKNQHTIFSFSFPTFKFRFKSLASCS